MNALVIVVDGLHLGYLGCYGNLWIETPVIDRLAAEGVVFDGCFSDCAEATAARRSWWTGLPPLMRVGSDRLQRVVAEDRDHLAALGGAQAVTNAAASGPREHLQRANVRTAIVTDAAELWPAGALEWFDEARVVGPASPPPPQPSPTWGEAGRPPHPSPPSRGGRGEGPRPSLPPRGGKGNEPAAGEEETPAYRVISEAAQWLEQHAERQPWLLWIELSDLRGPCRPPEPFFTMYLEETAEKRPHDLEIPDAASPGSADDSSARGGSGPGEPSPMPNARYAGAVSFVDALVGMLYDYLSENELLDETLVVLTSDHGADLGMQTVRASRSGPRGPAPRAGGSGSSSALGRLHEEWLHVPLVMRFPDEEHAGVRVAALVEPADLMPTLVEAIGKHAGDAAAGSPSRSATEGRSLLPLVRHEIEQVREYAIIGCEPGACGIRTCEWFLIPARQNREQDGATWQLYAKPEDRWELNDLAGQHPDVVADLAGKLREALERRG